MKCSLAPPWGSCVVPLTKQRHTPRNTSAAGSPLSLRQEELVQRGHAIECRIYAEDPAADFFPSPGKIIGYQEPTGPGVRVDSGVYEGYEVPMHYDPILSKLIVAAENRELARRRMIRALEDYRITGITTIIGFLLDVIRSVPFSRGDTFIDFVQTHFSGWKPDEDLARAAAAAYLVDEMLGPPASRNCEPGGISHPVAEPRGLDALAKGVQR